MKKIFFVPVFFILLLSCAEETIIDDLSPKEATGGIRISLSLSDEQFSPLRAFFDEDPIAEPWEQEVNTLTVCVYNLSNNTFFKRVFTSDEIAGRRFNFQLPTAEPGDECEFYAVANMEVTATDREELLAMRESAYTVYNSSSFEEVTSRACRPGGFVMSGYASLNIYPEGMVTYIAIKLRRTVAKIALEVQFSDEIKQNYPGMSFKTGQVGLDLAKNFSWVFPHDTFYPEWSLASCNQWPNIQGEKLQALFYAFESDEDMPTSMKGLYIRLSCGYEPEGNGQGINYICSYYVEIEGNGNGKILRNMYYRVQVIISGFWGSGIETYVSKSAWGGPYTENFIMDEKN